MAAMGATPAWATLASHACRCADAEWLEEFRRRVSAISPSATGGAGRRRYDPRPLDRQRADPGPRARAVPRCAARRARAGDLLAVTGTLGDAGAGLALVGKSAPRPPVGTPRCGRADSRFDYPTPRVEFGVAARGIATAAMDLSDGLAGICRSSRRRAASRARVAVERLPLHDALRAATPNASARLGARRRRRLRAIVRRAAGRCDELSGDGGAIELNADHYR